MSFSQQQISTPDALKLIEQLQTFVVHRNETVEHLRGQIKLLQQERDALKDEVYQLRTENTSLKSKFQYPTSEMNSVSTDITLTEEMQLETSSLSNGSNNSTCDFGFSVSTRETASHGESTSYDLVDEKRTTESDVAITITSPLIKSSHRSSFRRHRRSDSVNAYELSVDLREKTLECLENKYGGKEKANKAARIIQQRYRRWKLSKSFQRMRAYSERRHSITRMPGKHFEKLKKTSLVFYGPDNPIMIVDGEEEVKTSSSVCTATDINTGFTIAHDEEVQLEENHAEIEKDMSVLSLEKDETDSVKESQSEERAPLQKCAPRTSSSASLQYDIIDDASVFTVVGKHVDLEDGTSFAVDIIYEDDADGISFSAEASKYEPTFDKSMHKRQFRIGVNLFNWKPEVGIQYLIDNGHLEANVKSIADFFRRETTISKQKISEYFGSLRNPFNMKVLVEFAKSFDYVGKDVDEALRQFQSYFKLTGEAQTVEKFLQVFSERYVECNPGNISNSADVILLLAFALAMLNTDLHNQNVKRRMTPEEFLKNLRGTDDGNDMDQTMLRNMYTRIRRNEFATGADHTTQVLQIENSFVGKVPNLSASHRQFVKLFTIEELHDPNRRDKPHNRLAFLFNDLLILAKPRGKGGAHGSQGHMFSCKASYSLLGKRVAEFNNEYYPYGVLLLGKIDKKVVATFNAKDEKTKKSFVEELDEYIRETNGMENIRIALSKVKQLSWHNYRRKDDRTNSLLIEQDMDHMTKMDKAETISLMDLRINNSLEAEDVQRSNSMNIVTSASMDDINETESDEDTEYESLVRASSSSSLDPTFLTLPLKPRISILHTIKEAVYSPSVRWKHSSLRPSAKDQRPRNKEHRRSMPTLSNNKSKY